jgi:hypothetical protein
MDAQSYVFYFIILQFSPNSFLIFHGNCRQRTSIRPACYCLALQPVWLKRDGILKNQQKYHKLDGEIFNRPENRQFGPTSK